MLYRLKFDTAVNIILKRWGLKSIFAVNDFWPAGRSNGSVKIGKAAGLTPVEAACLSVAELAIKYERMGLLIEPERQLLLIFCAEHAEQNMSRIEVVNLLYSMTFIDVSLINIAKYQPKKTDERDQGDRFYTFIFVFIIVLVIWFIAVNII